MLWTRNWWRPEIGRDLWQALNASSEGDQQLRKYLCTQLFGKGGYTVWMQPPFYCDCGSNIELGQRVFFNFNCVVLNKYRSVAVAARSGVRVRYEPGMCLMGYRGLPETMKPDF